MLKAGVLPRQIFFPMLAGEGVIIVKRSGIHVRAERRGYTDGNTSLI